MKLSIKVVDPPVSAALKVTVLDNAMHRKCENKKVKRYFHCN